ncbi:hypothetical protein IMZ11_24840 [Microtetraspora sp. AC03309]|uniref:hypothetical protein n=1 Tax=Microtetraspora sp. AC03309 TaxID=2779376 RepID=UPI001E614EE4|nr:hypothetical protein [Microtetraspora sp. AC03309]MCC5578858.1 hypothetical protein [Microtetraspora sp. AC03309]
MAHHRRPRGRRGTLLTFTEGQGADAHCRSGGQRLAFARVYDWLDDVLTAVLTAAAEAA